MNTRATVPGMDKIKAYGYSRVSKVGDRGGDLFSPEQQQYAIEEWAARNNVEIVEHIVDLDQSGRQFEKRKVAQMIEGIRRGEASMVVLWKWSRWGRNTRASLVNIAQVAEAGGSVRAATEDYDVNTAMGKFTTGQMLMIAELQSDQIGEGWKETHARRRRSGLPHSATKRFGYDYVKGEGYVVNEDEAPILTELYTRYLAAETLSSIARDLNARGILTTRGSAWDTTSLGRMLDTGFAAGLIRERSVPGRKENRLDTYDEWRQGAHDPLIDAEQWEKYTLRRAAAAGRQGRAKGVTHTLSNLLLCGECGGNLVTRYSGVHHNWKCGSAMRNRQRGLEHHAPVSISNERLMTALRGWFLSNVEQAEVESAVERAPQPPAARSNTDNLEAEVAGLRADLKRLSRQLMQGRVSEDIFDELKAESDQALARAEKNLAAARADDVVLVRTPVDQALLAEVLHSWDVLTPLQLRMLLEPILPAVVVTSGPFSPAKVRPVAAWASRA